LAIYYMFNKLEYNRQYSKLYYLKQKEKLKMKGLGQENNISLDYMDIAKKKPIGNLALQRKRLERELRKNEARILEYNKTQGETVTTADDKPTMLDSTLEK
jgi:hypothetical protein